MNTINTYVIFHSLNLYCHSLPIPIGSPTSAAFPTISGVEIVRVSSFSEHLQTIIVYCNTGTFLRAWSNQVSLFAPNLRQLLSLKINSRHKLSQEILRNWIGSTQHTNFEKLSEFKEPEWVSFLPSASPPHLSPRCCCMHASFVKFTFFLSEWCRLFANVEALSFLVRAILYGLKNLRFITAFRQLCAWAKVSRLILSVLCLPLAIYIPESVSMSLEFPGRL